MSVNLSDLATLQSGKGAFGNLVVLVIIGFGIWVGIQYIPQRIEAGAMSSVLDKVEQRHYNTPIRDDRDLWDTINRQLHVNELGDMKEAFQTSWNGTVARVSYSYERELNLVFTTKEMKYSKQVILP